MFIGMKTAKCPTTSPPGLSESKKENYFSLYWYQKQICSAYSASCMRWITREQITEEMREKHIMGLKLKMPLHKYVQN